MKPHWERHGDIHVMFDEHNYKRALLFCDHMKLAGTQYCAVGLLGAGPTELREYFDHNKLRLMRLIEQKLREY